MLELVKRTRIDPAVAVAVADPSGPETPTPCWLEWLSLIERHLPFTRRTVHAGDVVQRAGDVFSCLHVVNLGTVKSVSAGDDGPQRVVALHLRGDWIGLDCIAAGRYASDAIAMDIGEVWSLRYVTLMNGAVSVPELMRAVHLAMSAQLARDRDRLLTLGRRTADERVADFVYSWAASLAQRGMRPDTLLLRMSRAEVGGYLGLTLETVSRSFSLLARNGLIRFEQAGRRNIAIPDIEALGAFVRDTVRRPATRAQRRIWHGAYATLS
jgi:CRP/FNR family transcriptional regulator